MNVTPRQPSTVAAVRGLILSLAAAIAAALASLTPLDLSDLGPWGPVVCILLVAVGRWLEGVILDRRQPPQAGLLGGEPAVLYDWPLDDDPGPAA